VCVSPIWYQHQQIDISVWKYIIHIPYLLHVSAGHVAIFREVQYTSFVLYLAEDGYMYAVYDMYNIISYTYTHLLVLIYLIAQCTVIDYLKLCVSPLHAYCFRDWKCRIWWRWRRRWWWLVVEYWNKYIGETKDIPLDAMKAYGRNGSITSPILNLSNRWGEFSAP